MHAPRSIYYYLLLCGCCVAAALMTSLSRGWRMCVCVCGRRTSTRDLRQPLRRAPLRPARRLRVRYTRRAPAWHCWRNRYARPLLQLLLLLLHFYCGRGGGGSGNGLHPPHTRRRARAPRPRLNSGGMRRCGVTHIKNALPAALCSRARALVCVVQERGATIAQLKVPRTRRVPLSAARSADTRALRAGATGVAARRAGERRGARA